MADIIEILVSFVIVIAIISFGVIMIIPSTRTTVLNFLNGKCSVGEWKDPISGKCTSCKNCTDGLAVLTKCSATTDTVCERPCTDGEWKGGDEKCNKCTTCAAGKATWSKCTGSTDTICTDPYLPNNSKCSNACAVDEVLTECVPSIDGLSLDKLTCKKDIMGLLETQPETISDFTRKWFGTDKFTDCRQISSQSNFVKLFTKGFKAPGIDLSADAMKALYLNDANNLGQKLVLSDPKSLAWLMSFTTACGLEPSILNEWAAGNIGS